MNFLKMLQICKFRMLKFELNLYNYIRYLFNLLKIKKFDIEIAKIIANIAMLNNIKINKYILTYELEGIYQMSNYIHYNQLDPFYDHNDRVHWKLLYYLLVQQRDKYHTKHKIRNKKIKLTKEQIEYEKFAIETLSFFDIYLKRFITVDISQKITLFSNTNKNYTIYIY